MKNKVCYLAKVYCVNIQIKDQYRSRVPTREELNPLILIAALLLESLTDSAGSRKSLLNKLY